MKNYSKYCKLIQLLVNCPVYFECDSNDEWRFYMHLNDGEYTIYSGYDTDEFADFEEKLKVQIKKILNESN